MDYYRVLGVSREASDEDIKKAYRKLVFQHHPDRNPNSTDAEARIREINAAYEIVGDAEKRRSYDRLFWGDEPRADVIDPTVILREMEQKLFDEGRKEIFAVLMAQVARVKSELALLRERTVAAQGYDSFKDDLVSARGAEVLEEFLTPEMEARKGRLIDVAAEMMASQGVVKKGDEGGFRALRGQLEESIRKGRLHGYASALELFYERR
ncbi:MAG: DnaJ domain-containing protein [Nitrospira sp.]